MSQMCDNYVPALSTKTAHRSVNRWHVSHHAQGGAQFEGTMALTAVGRSTPTLARFDLKSDSLLKF